MKIYLIFVEDRDEMENQIFSIYAESEDDAKDLFVKKYIPYINALDWANLREMLQTIDIYIHIISKDKTIYL